MHSSNMFFQTTCSFAFPDSFPVRRVVAARLKRRPKVSCSLAMAYTHPFGSTAADLKAALALSREADADANAEAQFASAIALSEDRS